MAFWNKKKPEKKDQRSKWERRMAKRKAKWEFKKEKKEWKRKFRNDSAKEAYDLERNQANVEWEQDQNERARNNGDANEVSSRAEDYQMQAPQEPAIQYTQADDAYDQPQEQVYYD